MSEREIEWWNFGMGMLSGVGLTVAALVIWTALHLGTPTP